MMNKLLEARYFYIFSIFVADKLFTCILFARPRSVLCILPEDYCESFKFSFGLYLL